MQRLYLKKALFCNSPLHNDNILIQDMHTEKALRSALPMQRFVSEIAFRETAQDKFCSVTKRYNVTYRCIAKCHKAIQNARVKQRIPDFIGLPYFSGFPSGLKSHAFLSQSKFVPLPRDRAAMFICNTDTVPFDLTFNQCRCKLV